MSARILVHTRHTGEVWTNPAQPGFEGRLADLDESVHLALSHDDGPFEPLHDGTGVLFATADRDCGVPGGVTRTLVDPWVLRSGAADGDARFILLAVRRRAEGHDPADAAGILVFRSDDLIRFDQGYLLTLEEPGALEVGECVRHPRAVWDVEMGEVGGYRLSWEIHGTHMRHRTGTSAGLRDLQRIEDASSPAAGDAAPPATATPIPAEQIPPTPIASASPPFANAILGNTLELTDAEVERLERTLLPVTNTGVEVADLSVVRKSEVQLEELPQAVCTYSDGSTHAKSVDWDHAALAAVDTDRPGTYEVPGRVRVRRDLFPFIDEFMSDPSICRIGDRFFLSSSRENAVSFRIAESIEGLRDAEWIDVLPVTNPSGGPANIWAQEMHVIQGVPYVFTTVGPEGWTSVQSVVVRCTGDPADPSAWDQPRPVVRPDGEVLAGKDGISLDMTWFEEGGRHYVMWSGRDFVDRTPGAEIADSADMLIATIDPAAPWQLTSEPVRFLRPMYGWDRCQTPVDEGPYLLRHGEDLFVTIAGSSTGLPDLYCVGLLRARSGSNLLDPSAWDWCPYPVLTKESVPGQFGPGHNAFLVDPETGDDLLIFHAVPHDAEGVALGRHMGIRRVHWDVNGLPDLRLTPERDLPVEREHVMCTVRVR